MNGSGLLSRRVTVVVNGKPYLVEVTGSLAASPINVKVNGRPYVVDIAPADPERPGAAAPAAALESVARETAAPPKARIPAGPAGPVVPSLAAPMPGRVLEIRCRPGDRVRYGQPLYTLEAMKMKNAILSPRDGTVATVEVREGQVVAHGQVLITFQLDGQAEGQLDGRSAGRPGGQADEHADSPGERG